MGVLCHNNSIGVKMKTLEKSMAWSLGLTLLAVVVLPI